MWDEAASHRVLSLVLCSGQHAVHLTMHDYVCPNHASSKLAFAEVEIFLRLAAGAT
jgi:hypothetical protein